MINWRFPAGIHCLSLLLLFLHLGLIDVQTFKEMVVPGSKVHVQAWRHHFTSISVVGRSRKPVSQTPGSTTGISPGELNPGLRRIVAEIDNDDVSLVVCQPAPS